MPRIDESDLAGLSEQERAALEETSDDEESLRAIAEKEGPADTGDDDDASGDDDQDDDAGDDKGGGKEEKAAPDAKAATDDAAAQAAAETQAAAAAEAAKAQAKPEPAAVEAPPVVAFTATAPDDAPEQIKALRAEEADAFKKLMDGELSPEEYSEKKAEVQDKVDDLQRQITTAEVAAKMTVQNAQRAYMDKVNTLLDTALKDDGIDYRKNEVLHDALDNAVKRLARDPANADKPEGWFLTTAHKSIKESFGLGKPAAAPPADPTTKKGGKAPDLSGLPPSVRSVPAASSADDGGEFAHLENLKGMALERAIAKLSPEQQQRWAEA